MRCEHRLPDTACGRAGVAALAHERGRHRASGGVQPMLPDQSDRTVVAGWRAGAAAHGGRFLMVGGMARGGDPDAGGGWERSRRKGKQGHGVVRREDGGPVVGRQGEEIER